MQTQFPEGTYRLVIGTNSTVPAILEELAVADVPLVLAADVERDSIPAEVHLVRGDPTQLAATLETPHAGDMVAQLLESGRDILAEVDADPATIGQPLSTVRGERSGLVLGLVHAGQFTLGIGDDPVLLRPGAGC